MRVSVAISSTGDFKVPVAEYDAAGRAGKASWVKLLTSISFEVLTFDATVAVAA